jgi:O-antigen ligase
MMADILAPRALPSGRRAPESTTRSTDTGHQVAEKVGHGLQAVPGHADGFLTPMHRVGRQFHVPSLTSLACGIVVVTVVTVPVLINPAGLDAFTAMKAAVVQAFGPIACVLWVLGVLTRRRPFQIGVLDVACAAAGLAFIAATAAGIAPTLSFFAPGPRHEGTYLMLSLVLMALAIGAFDAVQLDALLTACVIGSVAPSIYALTQAFTQWIDPDRVGAMERAGSTFGNPVLLGGYLVTVIPITAARLMDAHLVPRTSRRIAPMFYAAALTLQLGALLVAVAIGAWISLAVAAIVLLLGADLEKLRRPRLAFASAAALAVAAILMVFVVSVVRPGLIEAPTVMVRTLIWQSVSSFIAAHPARLGLGFGPDMLGAVVSPFVSSKLVAYEGAFAVPDRAHNEMLDLVAAIGLVGAATMIALHLLVWSELLALLRGRGRRPVVGALIAPPLAGGALMAMAIVLAASRQGLPALPALAVAVPVGLLAGSLGQLMWMRTRGDGTPLTPGQWLVVGLLAASMTHFAEIQVGMANIGSRLVWWCDVGILIALGRLNRATISDRFVGPRDAPRALNLVAALTVIVTCLLMLWQYKGIRDLASPVELLTAGDLLSNQVFVWFIAYGLLAIAAAMAGGDRESSAGSAPLLALAAAAPIAAALTFAAVRHVRADVFARLADRARQEEQWVEATALQRRRAEVAPESDVAWSALASAELDAASHINAPDRSSGFERASSAALEAYHRKPFDWLHVRNLASIERVWAIADKERRAEHLAAADRRLHQASTMAPGFAQLWAEWGNLEAERGSFHEAFAKLERAAALGGRRETMAVADAIFRASGLDVRDPNARARAVEQLNNDGCPALAALYAAPPPPQ